MVKNRTFDEIGREKIRKVLKSCKKIADLGCSKEKIREDADGYDNDIEVGADFVCDLNGELPIFDSSYNGICISHFLEHVIDCREFLKLCYYTLKMSGKIAITVPDGEDVPSETLGDADGKHEMLFTPTTLKLYLENAGFNKVYTEYYDRPTAWKQTKGIFGHGVKG